MNRPDSGRVLLITGAGRGIGAATAVLAGRQGWRVVVNYLRDEFSATRVTETIRQNGGVAFCVQADISDEDSVISLFNIVDSEFGRLDGLVNNAGILETQMKLESMDGGRLDRVFATNVRGSFLCAREAVKRMSSQHGGHGGAIVNVSSAASRLGSANEYVDYAASKGAIDTMTIGLAREVATEGIRVNAVRPGLIETEIHSRGGEPGRAERLQQHVPLKRPGRAEEVAEAIVWLLSEEASYCTGAFLECAGGR